MKSGRATLVIAYNERVEEQPGVWENNLTRKKVKAEQQRIFQSRRDRAQLDGQVITARFKVRQDLGSITLDYVEWHEDKYKVSSINPNTRDHYTIIELGELV